MKRLLFIILSIYSLTQVKAQQPLVVFGEEERYDSRLRSLNFIGNNQDLLFLQKEIENNGSWILEGYSIDSLKRELTVDIAAPEFQDGDLELLSVFELDGRFLMLHALRMKSGGKRKLFLSPLSHKGEFMDIPTEVGEVPELKRREDLFFGITLSPDSSKFLLYYSLNNQASQGAVYSLNVFNSSLESIFKKELELPYSNELLNIDKMLVDNNGVAYILSGVLPEKAASKVDRKSVV